MNNIYNATVDAVKRYTHTKQHTALNVCAAHDKPVETSDNALSKMSNQLTNLLSKMLL